MRFAIIGVLGVTGVFCRYIVDSVTTHWVTNVPIGTLLINLLGSFLAGFVFVLGERGTIPTDLRIGLLVGFLGGFTTFSAYSLQSAKLLETGNFASGIFYFCLSPILGIAAAFLGLWLGSK